MSELPKFSQLVKPSLQDSSGKESFILSSANETFGFFCFFLFFLIKTRRKNWLSKIKNIGNKGPFLLN